MSWFPMVSFDDEKLTKVTICRECEHRDCKYWRDVRKKGCYECKKPFESGESVTSIINDYAHMKCVS